MMHLHYSFCVSRAGYRSWPWSRIRYDGNHDVGLLRNESDTEKSKKYLKLRSLHIERACIRIHYSNACKPFAELPNQTWFAWMLSLPWALKEPMFIPFKGLVHLYYNCLFPYLSPSLLYKSLKDTYYCGVFNFCIPNPSTAPRLL